MVRLRSWRRSYCLVARMKRWVRSGGRKVGTQLYTLKRTSGPITQPCRFDPLKAPSHAGLLRCIPRLLGLLLGGERARRRRGCGSCLTHGGSASPKRTIAVHNRTSPLDPNRPDCFSVGNIQKTMFADESSISKCHLGTYVVDATPANWSQTPI